MAIIQPTPDHVLDRETIEKLKTVNSTAVIDILARNGHDPRYIYMPNIRTMNPGVRLVARAITVRFLPARADLMAEKPGGEESPEYAAFELAGPGDVIVMESMRTKLMSIGGDIKFLRLKQAASMAWSATAAYETCTPSRTTESPCTATIKPRTSARVSELRFHERRPSIATVFSSNQVTTSSRTTTAWYAFPVTSRPDIAQKAIEYDDLEEWIRARLDRENLTPGKYYPPDDAVIALYRSERDRSG